MKDKTEISVLYSSGGFQDGFFNPPSSPSRLCGRLTKHSDCPHGRPGDAEDGALIQSWLQLLVLCNVPGKKSKAFCILWFDFYIFILYFASHILYFVLSILHFAFYFLYFPFCVLHFSFCILYFQDVFLDGMMPLQKTKRLIGEQGTTFEVSTSIWSDQPTDGRYSKSYCIFF